MSTVVTTKAIRVDTLTDELGAGIIVRGLTGGDTEVECPTVDLVTLQAAVLAHDATAPTQDEADDATRRGSLSGLLGTALAWSDQQDADAAALAALPSGNNNELAALARQMQTYLAKWGPRDATQRRRLVDLIRLARKALGMS